MVKVSATPRHAFAASDLGRCAGIVGQPPRLLGKGRNEGTQRPRPRPCRARAREFLKSIPTDLTLRRCAEYKKICLQTVVGFAIMGFIGFFVKLIFIVSERPAACDRTHAHSTHSACLRDSLTLVDPFLAPQPINNIIVGA